MNKLCKTTLIIFLFVFLINISLISAQMDFDNIKGDLIIDETTSKYGRIEIKDWFGLQSLAKIEPMKNTDKCGWQCSAEIEIIMYQDSVLIDDVKFIGGAVKSYNFYIKTGEKEITIEDYNRVCETKSTLNATKYKVCEIKKTGSHNEIENIYESYKLGTEVKAGTYYIKLEGTKDLGVTTDWQIITQGKLLNEFLEWGSGGDGTLDNPYQIYNWTQMNMVDDNLTASYILMNNLNLSTPGYIDVASSTANAGAGFISAGSFIGIFDGNGKTISDFVIYRPTNNNLGLFSQCQTSCIIKNLKITNASVTGTDTSAILAGYLNAGGTILNVSVQGNLTGLDGYNGGICGQCNSGSIINDSYANVRVTSANAGGGLGGGAFTNTMVGNSYAVGFVSGAGTVGGLFAEGSANIIISNSFWDNQTTGQASSYGGGTAKTTAQMKNLTTFTNAGWDIIDYSSYAGETWFMNGTADYPRLWYEYVTSPSIVTTTLNSPIDYFNSSSNSITFNCSANTTSPSGETIANISLWLNITGNWILNETTYGGGTSNISIFTKNISNGLNYQWTCFANDTSGVSAWATNRTFTIDTTSPLISIISPANNTNSTDRTLDIDYTVSDSTLQSCWYSNDTFAVNTTLMGCVNITNILWSLGQHDMTIWANDTFGNVNSSSVRFTIDLSLPNVTLTSPIDDYISPINQITFTCSANSTAGAAIQNISLWTNVSGIWTLNETIINNAYGSYISRFDTTISGDTTIEGVSTNGSNIAIFNTVVGIDKVSIFDMNGNYIKNWNTLNASFTDNTGITNNGSNWFIADETGSSIHKFDINGNWLSYCITGVATGFIDITNNNSNFWLVSVGTKQIYELDMNCNVLHNYDSGSNNPTGIAMNGSNIFVIDQDANLIMKKDFMGNQQSNFSLHADNNLAFGLELYNNIFYVGQWTGVLTGVYEYSNGEITNSQTASFTKNIDTTFDWTCKAFDSYGESSWASENRTVSVDVTYPLISIVYPANNTNSTNNNLNINYTRSDENLNSCWYSNDTMAVNTTLTGCTNITSIIWAEGQHNIIIWANDTIGNTNSSSVRFTIDSLTPLINITSPINDTYSNNINMNINYTFSDINIQSCWYSNNTYISNITITCGVNITTIIWTEGLHNITIWANDTFGNVNSSSIMFIIDTHNPNATLLTPTNNTITNINSQNFTVNLTDNIGINNGTLFIYNKTGELVNETSRTFELNLFQKVLGIFVTLGDGAYNWFYNVFDFAGNNYVTENSTLTIDTIIPLINITYPINDTNSTNNNLNINYTRSDTNLQSCWYSNDTMAVNTTLTSCTNITSVTWADGIHDVTIWANDTAGNINYSRVRFTIDSTTPIITINSPIRLIDYGYAGKNETLEWTITDSNLASIWYKYNPTYNYSSTLNYLFDDNFTNVAPANDLAAGTYYFNLVNTQTFLNISSWDAANAVSYTDTIILTSCSNNLITLIKNSTASGAYYNFLCGSTSLGSVIYSRVGLNFHYPSEITLNNINNNQTYTAYGASNSTNFTLKKDFYAITVYANDSYGNINSSYVEWVYKIFYNNETYNTQSYETSTETFTINVTANSSLTSANLIYGVNSYAGTNLGSGIWSKTLDIPLGSANNNFYWNFTYAGNQISSLTKTQTVNYTNLSICGGTGGNTIFLNFSFKDETTGNFINVSNDLADFDYWLGSGTVTKPYIFTNTTENFLYQFCAVPNKTITVDLSYKYSKTGYPQRTFVYDNQLLTNSTTSKTLYLLSNVDGIYSTLQFLDAGTNAPISGVTVIIQREIAGLWTLISQGLTDATGSITFWVNPNYEHLITGTRIGYAGVSKIITPTQSSYTIFMGVSSNISVPGYRYKNIKYITYPGSGRLEPNTVYIFGFNVTATDGNIISCKIDIKNLTLSTVATSSVGCGEYGGNISVSYNTGSNSKLFGYYYIDIGSGIELFKANDAWFIEYQNITSSGGLKGFFDALRDLPEFGDTHNRQEFSKIVFFFFMMILVIGLFTFFSGIDLSSPGAALILVWAFIAFGSVSGIIKIEGLSPFSWWNQYGIFIITSFLFFGFILNMMRRDSN